MKELLGKVIAFEGIEATGKTSLAKILKERLEKKGEEVVITREPGGVESAESIRDNIMDYEVDPKTEMLLYAAARREHLVSKIQPLLKEGKIILCDRFVLSSITYQGYGRGLDIDMVRQVNNYVLEGFQPFMTVYIDIPVETSLKRKLNMDESEINRMDLQGDSFYNRVREGYLKEIELIPNCVAINGEQELEKIADEILEHYFALTA